MDQVNLLANNNASFSFSRVLTPWADVYPLAQGKFRAQMRRTPTDSVVYYEWSSDNGRAQFNSAVASGAIAFAGNPAPQAAAAGTLLFPANPAAGATITLGSTVVTFVTAGATGNQVNVGGSLAATLASLLALLQASSDPQIALCSYAVAGNNLNITYKTTGAAGNSFAIATTVASGSSSGATLAGGISSDITLGTSRVAFVASGATGNQVNVAATLAGTLASLLALLQASSDPQLIQCSYALVGSALNVSFKTAGTTGNSFALATTVAGATVTGATLSGAGGVLTLAAAVADLGSFTGTYYYDCRFEYGAEFIPLFGGTISWQQGVTRT